MQIELLADRPEFIPTLAEWHFSEWAYLRPGDSVANRVRLLHERSGRCELPITFVASDGSELLGSAMLIHHEMDTRPDYTPWLAGVFGDSFYMPLLAAVVIGMFFVVRRIWRQHTNQ